MKHCYSLKKNKDFQRVYRAGQSVGSRTLVFLYRRTSGSMLRVGFSVSKKVGGSVVRNRVKRRLRESFRLMMPGVKTGYDMIFIAREPVVGDKFQNIQKTMRYLLGKANLLNGAEKQ